ncbi:MAG: helix-turn-helix domain-containing protein, partial [Actinobacteria bacterium]|nr:helix-turn-helix domain-containing protein [Actinomycetota bacterium]
MATGIGDTLRATRERQDRTRADAAADTRIREQTLRALEEERFAGLGGAVYVKGFLRSYGRFLGLDPEELVRAYERRPDSGDPAPAILAVPADVPVRRSGARVGVAAVLALALVLAGAVLLADPGRHPRRRP